MSLVGLVGHTIWWYGYQRVRLSAEQPSQKAELRPDTYEKANSTADGFCFVG
jgi:hypothetical protein